jgi:hypothetical protein
MDILKQKAVIGDYCLFKYMLINYNSTAVNALFLSVSSKPTFVDFSLLIDMLLALSVS